ncbi:TPA: TrkH family potassium uptake protein [Candidatus Poribacteria bacterium]|nr:TrkH family potassium uptake protein [Candidatus Poribacteria bacterium]
MRNGFWRVNYIFYSVGGLLETLGLIILTPVTVALIYWGRYGEGWRTLMAFLIPAISSFLTGMALRKGFKAEMPDVTGSMIMCAMGWLFASAFGALPFVIGIGSGYLNAYFEAMSGFTTTGITVYAGLDGMPRSILFWRSLTQWLGGVGILSFFLITASRKGNGAHYIFSAESHKISSGRPTPGLFNTLKILWGIYGMLTVSAMTVLTFEGMPLFDSICHALTALSTGGFSPHDSSIEYYSLAGYPRYRLMEYTLSFFMMLGGINFLVHYRVLTGDIRALWDNIEIRYWWRFIAVFTILIMVDHLRKVGISAAADPGELERSFRYSLFQVISILTTTGFGTKDIGSDFFPALSKQLFLVMMVIGGCVGSTGGGIKVMRVAILNRLILRELFKLRTSGKAVNGLVIDRKMVSSDEISRTAALFFAWMALLVIGGGITAIFSGLGPWESFSGMFSALGNIGPCYISVREMIGIHPIVKITYIFGMLAGRLEILPVFLLFSRKAWRW